ncbi:MAG: hypothetical protein GF398_20400 [Chitinivibrionales bacterium]|nr:hypothetical protein [Chitinivibrionales bacterium]
MAEFHQDKIITSIHSLYDVLDPSEYLAAMESKLNGYSAHNKISVLLPAHISDVRNSKVMNTIFDKLSQVTYLHEVIVALGGVSEQGEFRKIREHFQLLIRGVCKIRVVWVDGPRMQEIMQVISEREISVGTQGKGQSVWLALGYIFAKDESSVVALHDCDIVTYDRTFLARLVEPTANPDNDIEFCKGFYARISPTDKAMKGRVTRLFVTPFVDCCAEIMRNRGFIELHKFFAYHKAFKYPLAGEFCLTTELARGINVAWDWSLEVATLSQVFDQLIPRKIAQIDLAKYYEHKHQELSCSNENAGLHKMVVDIAKFYLTYMRSHGIPLDDAFVDMLIHTYYQNALKYIRLYSYDAEANSLHFDLYQEEATARHFRSFLWTAWEQSKGPHEAKLIPSWNRIKYALPGIYDQLIAAVEADHAG